MNIVLDEISESKFFGFKNFLLVNLSSISQKVLFTNHINSLAKYIIISPDSSRKDEYKEVRCLSLKNFINLLPDFKIFISLNPFINNEKFILKIVLKKPVCKKAFFICNSITVNKIVNKNAYGCENRLLVYLKILYKIKFTCKISWNVNDKHCSNSIIKIVSRNKIPKFNFFKWDYILKTLYNIKKTKFGKILKLKQFLKYICEILMKISSHFQIMTVQKNHVQRVLEENGVLSSKICNISIKDYIFLLNSI
jgi:hypothetical protein